MKLSEFKRKEAFFETCRAIATWKALYNTVENAGICLDPNMDIQSKGNAIIRAAIIILGISNDDAELVEEARNDLIELNAGTFLKECERIWNEYA